MKKIILISSMLFGIVFSTKSQEIGARFGDVLGNDIALDAILSSGGSSRLHADVSFGDAVGVELLWDFLYRPIGDTKLNWYLGAGISSLFGDDNGFDDDEDFLFGASGEAGLEYHFDGLPISVGADWRPTYWFIGDSEFHTGGWGLNARFVFK